MKRRLVWAPAQAGCPMAVSQQWRLGGSLSQKQKSWLLVAVGRLDQGFFNPQFSSVAQLCLTLCELDCSMDCSMPVFPVRQQLPNLLKLMSMESVMPSNHLTFCHPLLPPLIFPSIRVFSNESVLHQVANVLEFQLQHQSF